MVFKDILFIVFISNFALNLAIVGFSDKYMNYLGLKPKKQLKLDKSVKIEHAHKPYWMFICPCILTPFILNYLIKNHPK